MNTSDKCEPPFLSGEDKLCDLTVAVFYEPFSYYLRVTSTIVSVLTCLSLLVILVSFLKAHNTFLCKRKKQRSKLSSEKQRKFFKYNLFTIVFLVLGTLFQTYLAYNNFLYDVEFTSHQGKLNAICVVFLAVFYYIGTFSFLPIIKELLGLTYLDPKKERIQTVSVFLSKLITIPVAITEFQNLTDYYAKNRQSSEELNKLYTFLVKLKAFRNEISFHSLFLVFIAAPNLVLSLNTTKVVLLIDSIYLAFIPLELIPSYLFFSKFIFPGSERCFSFDPTRKEQVSSGKSLREIPELSENLTKGKELAIKPEKDNFSSSL
eukprot:snap_masked-scaffold_28-processed-gene-1.19-mRNA-1 protein AED:1.00 eAED:1.00 QI:0/0/0/0/1/1/2/0/318